VLGTMPHRAALAMLRRLAWQNQDVRVSSALAADNLPKSPENAYMKADNW